MKYIMHNDVKVTFNKDAMRKLPITIECPNKECGEKSPSRSEMLKAIKQSTALSAALTLI